MDEKIKIDESFRSTSEKNDVIVYDKIHKKLPQIKEIIIQLVVYWILLIF